MIIYLLTLLPIVTGLPINTVITNMNLVNATDSEQKCHGYYTLSQILVASFASVMIFIICIWAIYAIYYLYRRCKQKKQQKILEPFADPIFYNNMVLDEIYTDETEY